MSLTRHCDRCGKEIKDAKPYFLINILGCYGGDKNDANISRTANDICPDCIEDVKKELNKAKNK